MANFMTHSTMATKCLTCGMSVPIDDLYCGKHWPDVVDMVPGSGGKLPETTTQEKVEMGIS
jgi:hypothetical protein